jgi:hypothetical protein
MNEHSSEVLRELLKEVGRARSEALAIRMVCGVLLGEIALKDPDPRIKLDHISALLSSAIHPPVGKAEKLSVGVIKTKSLNDIIGYAEQLLASQKK